MAKRRRGQRRAEEKGAESHRQPDTLDSERSSKDSEKSHADESRLVFLIFGDGKDARQPISPADNDPAQGKCGASNCPWP